MNERLELKVTLNTSVFIVALKSGLFLFSQGVLRKSMGLYKSAGRRTWLSSSEQLLSLPLSLYSSASESPCKEVWWHSAHRKHKCICL